MRLTLAIFASYWINGIHAQQSGFAGDVIAYDFSNFNGTLSFESVVRFRTPGSSCQLEQQVLKGPIAPLDQGLTAVFRGPLNLKQFAVYHLDIDLKRTIQPAPNSDIGFRRYRLRQEAAHQRFHTKYHPHRRNCGDLVTATIFGQVVSFIDDWDCTKTSVSSQSSWTGVPTTHEPSMSDGSTDSASTKSDSLETLSAQASIATALGNQENLDASWKRTAYYSALQPSLSHNLTFIYPVGYSHTDFLPSTGETSGEPAPSAEILGDVLIPDNRRFYIASDVPVIEDAMPQNKAYQGFRGSKIILVEMSMPLSGLRDQSPYPDQPAFWLLNEQLPNIDDASLCSCWASGCGEFDVHEVITAGAELGYSALHMGQQYCGGAENGFRRAVNDTQKLAVIVKAGSSGATSIVRILELGKGYVFAESIGSEEFDGWAAKPVPAGGTGNLLFGGVCPDASALRFERA